MYDPKRKIHKPVKGVLRLEIEKHQVDHADVENISESGSLTNDSVDPGDPITDSTFGKLPNNGSDGPQGSHSKWNSFDGKEISGNGSVQKNQDWNADDVSISLDIVHSKQFSPCIFLLLLTECMTDDERTQSL